VIRSANTGVSCVIDPWGNIVESRPWDNAAVIKRTIPLCAGLTFYDRFGDIISKLSLILGALLLVYTIISVIKKRTRRG
jgi:apolipoprotein N-acyltransferase